MVGVGLFPADLRGSPELVGSFRRFPRPAPVVCGPLLRTRLGQAPAAPQASEGATARPARAGQTRIARGGL